MRPDSPLPGILTLGGLTIIILLIAWAASGCATTTIYRDGRPVARFQGNMTNMVFAQSAKGAISWQAKSVSHSAATLAGGRAISAVTVPAASVITSNQFAP